jgi:hypothetical protein
MTQYHDTETNKESPLVKEPKDDIVVVTLNQSSASRSSLNAHTIGGARQSPVTMRNTS